MGFWVEPIDEDVARKVARIVGSSSAYGRAMAELDARRAAGEDLILVETEKKAILVVPRADVIDSIVLARKQS